MSHSMVMCWCFDQIPSCILKHPCLGLSVVVISKQCIALSMNRPAVRYGRHFGIFIALQFLTLQSLRAVDFHRFGCNLITAGSWCVALRSCMRCTAMQCHPLYGVIPGTVLLEALCHSRFIMPIWDKGNLGSRINASLWNCHFLK